MGDVTEFLSRQGIVVGGLLALAMSLAIGGVASILIVSGLQKVGAIKEPSLSGPPYRRRKRRQ